MSYLVRPGCYTITSEMVIHPGGEVDVVGDGSEAEEVVFTASGILDSAARFGVDYLSNFLPVIVPKSNIYLMFYIGKAGILYILLHRKKLTICD